MKGVLLLLAFILELVAFIGFSCLSFLVTHSTVLGIVMAIALFTLLIVFWSMYMAPKAKHKFSPLPYYASKTIIYCLSAIVLWVKIKPEWSLAFIALAILDEAILFKHNLS